MSDEQTVETVENKDIIDPSTSENTQLTETKITPEFLEELQQAFDLNVADGEMQFSRIAIMQPGSPEIANMTPGYSAGMLADNVTRDILTEGIKPPWLVDRGIDPEDLQKVPCCSVIPVFKLPSEFIKWKDIEEEGGGWHWKTLDRSDPKVREGVWPKSGGTWGKKPGQEGAPPVTENCNYLFMILNSDYDPVTSFIVGTFARTSFKAGIKLTTAIKTQRLKKILHFQKCYWLFTKAETREKNGKTHTSYAMDVTGGPTLTSIDPECGIQESVIEMIKFLSDKEYGRERQEMMINSAQMDHEDDKGTNDLNPDDEVFSDAGIDDDDSDTPDF